MSVKESPIPRLSSLRWNTVQRIARQQTRDSLFGWSFYLVATVAVLAAVLLVYNSVRFVGESGLNLITRPFSLPLQAVTTLGLLYVTLEATLVIARPREQGSLQVLFFAPIDSPMLIGAYFLAGLAVYALFLLFIIVPLLLLSWLTNFVVPPALLWGLLPTVLIAGLSVAFGLFVSSASPSSRSAVLILVAAVLVLLAVQGAYAALINIPPTSRYYDALLFLRIFLRDIQNLLQWISPIRMVDAMLDAALRVDLAALALYIGAAILGTVFWLAASVWALRRRGVLP